MYKRSRNRATTIAFIVTLGVSILVPTATAFAERATVELKDGSVVSGELRSYVPGKQVAIAVGGKVLTIAAADYTSVTTGSKAAPSTSAAQGHPEAAQPPRSPSVAAHGGPAPIPDPREPAPQAAQGTASQAGPVHSEPARSLGAPPGLLVQTGNRRAPNTSLVLPVMLISAGSLAMIVGGAVFATRSEPYTIHYSYGEEERVNPRPVARSGGKALMIGGAAIFLTGLIVLPVRLVARNRVEHASNATRPSVAHLSPWLEPHGSKGASVGLTGTLRF